MPKSIPRLVLDKVRRIFLSVAFVSSFLCSDNEETGDINRFQLESFKC